MANLIQEQQEKIKAEIAKIDKIITQYEEKIEPKLDESKEQLIKEATDSDTFASKLREIIAETGIFDKLGLDKDRYINVVVYDEWTEVAINIYADKQDTYSQVPVRFDIWKAEYDDSEAGHHFIPILEFDRMEVEDNDVRNRLSYLKDDRRDDKIKVMNERLIGLELVKYFSDIEYDAFMGKSHQLGNEFIDELRQVRIKVNEATAEIDQTRNKYKKFYDRKAELEREYEKVLDTAIIQAIYAEGGIKFRRNDPKKGEGYPPRLVIKPSGDQWDNTHYISEIKLGKETEKTLQLDFFGFSRYGSPKDDIKEMGSYRQSVQDSVKTLVNYWKKYMVKPAYHKPVKGQDKKEAIPYVEAPLIEGIEITPRMRDEWGRAEEGEYDRYY